MDLNLQEKILNEFKVIMQSNGCLTCLPFVCKNTFHKASANEKNE